jgi:hypothetical protein
MAPEVARSVLARRRWERGEVDVEPVQTPVSQTAKALDDPVASLRKFQSDPETMAQRMGEAYKDAKDAEKVVEQTVKASDDVLVTPEDLSAQILEAFREAIASSEGPVSMDELAEVAARTALG